MIFIYIYIYNPRFKQTFKKEIGDKLSKVDLQQNLLKKLQRDTYILHYFKSNQIIFCVK